MGSRDISRLLQISFLKPSGNYCVNKGKEPTSQHLKFLYQEVVNVKQQHSLPAMAAVAVLMLAITACGGKTPAVAPGETSLPTETAAASVSPSPAPSPTSSPTPVPTESASTQEPAKTEDAIPQVIKGTGVYVGQIDNHSIEITTEEGSTAFELGEGTESALEALKTDDPVVFEYVEKSVPGDDTVKQRVISKISLATDK